MAAPMRSNASCWRLVGSVRTGTVAGVPAKRIVAGQGGEVVQESLVAEVGAAVLVVLPAGLGLGGCRAGRGGDRVGGLGRFLVGVGQRRPGLAQVPGEVGGEHADQHVAPDALFEAVEDGAQVEVVGFDVPEVAFKEKAVMLA